MADARRSDTDLAFELAELASAVALQCFAEGVESATKADGSPVSSADLEVERRLVEQLAARRPGDGILSEEGGGKEAGGSRRWILDPIDGTVNFLERTPHWGTNIALEDEGRVVLGVITRPIAGEQWWADRHTGAFRSDIGRALTTSTPLRVSEVADLRDARITVWPVLDDAAEAALRASCQLVESDFTVLLRLLDGEIDGIVARAGGVWDHAPCAVLVEECGGRFRDLHGGTRLDTGGAIYTNGRIDAQLFDVLDAVDRASGTMERVRRADEPASKR